MDILGAGWVRMRLGKSHGGVESQSIPACSHVGYLNGGKLQCDSLSTGYLLSGVEYL